MKNDYKIYNDNYIPKTVITNLRFTDSEITDLLGYHYHNNAPKFLRIEITETLTFEYQQIFHDKEHNSYGYELCNIIYKDVKNIEKFKGQFEVVMEE